MKLLVTSLALSVGTTGASAQPHSNRSALPGGGRAVLLQPSETVATLSVAGGYGYTGSVLGEGDRHHRLAGRLALAIHPIEALSFGLNTSGYRDAHSGDFGSDDSIVGDMGLFVLARLVHAGALRLGVGAELRASPGDGTGFEVGGLSPSGTLHAQIDLGGGALVARVGYLHDRGRQTVTTSQPYSRADQVSLGVTAADAVLFGVGAFGRVGVLDLYAELALDLLVRRSGVPMSASRSSATLGGMVNFARRYQLGAELAFHLGIYPEIRDERLYRVEPRMSLMVTMVARLGALPSESAGASEVRSVSLRGVVRDDGATPVVDARVRLESTGQSPVVVAEATPSEDGSFTLSGVVPGEYELVVSAEGRHDVRTRHTIREDVELADVRVGTFSRALRGRVESPSPGEPVSVTVLDGDREVARVEVGTDGAFTLAELPPGTLTLVFEGESLTTRRETIPPGQSGELDAITMVAALPDGEIRGTVLGTRGVPVAARIFVVPGDLEAQADSDGHFSVVTTPGPHTVRVEAAGYTAQDRRIVVEERGVVVLEVHLRAAR